MGEAVRWYSKGRNKLNQRRKRRLQNVSFKTSEKTIMNDKDNVTARNHPQSVYSPLIQLTEFVGRGKRFKHLIKVNILLLNLQGLYQQSS